MLTSNEGNGDNEGGDANQVNKVNNLTSRECQVLRFVANGLSNQEIADRLTTSVPTINSHIEHIRFKLDAKNRTHAVVKALLCSQLTLAEIDEIRWD